MTMETLTTTEVAAELGVHPVTLRKWRAKSSEVFGVMEDCQGLMWWHRHERLVVYCAASVQRLKRILERRKAK